MSTTAVTAMAPYSARLRCVRAAPIIVSTSPRAASGVREGTIPVSAGTTIPIAPKTSRAPMMRDYDRFASLVTRDGACR